MRLPLAILAAVVRAGGLAYAATLPEPLPRPDAATRVRDWLTAATELAGGPDVEETAARWLCAVATIIEVRQLNRSRA
ncbi:hypothetical protein [Streptomyces sp. NPDC052015]|uniref:hypothetical protein n=1 Tax=Streptomyces sp. NPDC052015 TaxID=3154755 RepID=UPI00342CA186